VGAHVRPGVQDVTAILERSKKWLHRYPKVATQAVPKWLYKYAQVTTRVAKIGGSGIQKWLHRQYVRPGVRDVTAILERVSEFSIEDLPTLLRPTNATLGLGLRVEG